MPVRRSAERAQQHRKLCAQVQAGGALYRHAPLQPFLCDLWQPSPLRRGQARPGTAGKDRGRFVGWSSCTRVSQVLGIERHYFRICALTLRSGTRREKCMRSPPCCFEGCLCVLRDTAVNMKLNGQCQRRSDTETRSVVEPLESAMTWPMFVRSYVYERK